MLLWGVPYRAFLYYFGELEFTACFNFFFFWHEILMLCFSEQWAAFHWVARLTLWTCEAFEYRAIPKSLWLY